MLQRAGGRPTAAAPADRICFDSRNKCYRGTATQRSDGQLSADASKHTFKLTVAGSPAPIVGTYVVQGDRLQLEGTCDTGKISITLERDK